MEQIRIHTAIHSRYQVFDASGQLPFSIVFGLCRRSPADTDARPLILHTANSTLDVPYAISHGLFTLHEQPKGDGQETLVNLSGQLKSSDTEGETYLTLSSPVNRTEHWREAITTYEYHIDPDSELASRLQPGKKYTIRLASEDLGVKWWIYGNDDQHLGNLRSTTQVSETAKLVNSKASAGKASFTVVSALQFPPKVEIHMRLCQNEDSASNADGESTLELQTVNTGTRPITVQTRGTQRFLVPWDCFQPEQAVDDSQPRIIDGASPAPECSLQIVDAATDKVIREPKKPGPCRGLTSPNADRRPKLESLVTLKSGEPFVRHVNISKLLSGLADGKYRVRMEPRGVWWCVGSHEEIADEEDDRVPRRLYHTTIPPLILKTEDFVELQIEDGKVVK
ncbi:hypothetical protein F5Y19DRAFT_237640 [Xylariaceae sp. FL1651]|nr:hypothetical protein F5Y19DRAFT_237640 [Xylariaceae sp. FL1651]